MSVEYVSPDEAIELLRVNATDPEWIGWGLLGEQIKLHLRDLESIGLRLVRTPQDDRSEDGNDTRTADQQG